MVILSLLRFLSSASTLNSSCSRICVACLLVAVFQTVSASVSPSGVPSSVPQSTNRRIGGSLSTTISPSIEPLPSDPKSDSRVSGLPVGAWIGIGFGIFVILLIGVIFFIGHKRVTEYFVGLLARRQARPVAPVQKGTHSVHLESVVSSSHSRSSQKGGSSTPRTATPEIPFATFDFEADGRMSPRLPIASRRSHSTGGTPMSSNQLDK